MASKALDFDRLERDLVFAGRVVLWCSAFGLGLLLAWLPQVVR